MLLRSWAKRAKRLVWASSHFPGRLRPEKSPFHCLHNDGKGVLELGRSRPDLRSWWGAKLGEGKLTADCKSCSILKRAPEDEPGSKPQPPAGPAGLGKHVLPLDAGEQRALTPRSVVSPAPPPRARHGGSGVSATCRCTLSPGGPSAEGGGAAPLWKQRSARRKFRSPRRWVGGGG